MAENSKKYSMNYRQRVYFCAPCNSRIEVLGEQEPVAKCTCCKKPVQELKLEMDNTVSVKKTITPNPK